MSLSGDYVNGTFHLCLRLKGDPKRIEVFHAVMWGMESDWPWKPTGQTKRPFTTLGYTHTYSPSIRVCDDCHGVVICNPRINASDIKAAAKQCGIKAKIDKFSEAIHCWEGGKAYAPVSIVFQREGRRLFQHKASRYQVKDGYVLVGNETVEERKGSIKIIELPPASVAVQ